MSVNYIEVMMSWNRNSLMILTGAAIVVSGLIYRTNDANVAANPELAVPVVAKRLQKRELDPREELKLVAYQEDETVSSPVLEMVNELRQGATSDPVFDREVAVQEDLGERVDATYEKEVAVDTVTGSNWRTNPMMDLPMSSAVEVEEVTQVAPTTPAVQREAPRRQIAPTSFSISESVAQKSVHHIEYGKSLARRGAAFAARHEFLMSLRIISQAIDAQGTQGYYTRALNQAVTALKEVEDFFPGHTDSHLGIDAASIVEVHRSKIVSLDDARSMSATQVMQRYFAFAEYQLTLAVGKNVVSSEALYCLGKLSSVLAKNDPNPDRLDAAKAIMFHRAALACNSQNHRSANELGSLLARSGQMEDAKILLKQSLRSRPTPEAWANLAIVHGRLGETHLANLANNEYVAASQRPISQSYADAIQWMGPEQFDSEIPMNFHESMARRPMMPTPVAPQVGSPVQVEPETDSPKLIRRLKDWF